jgi:hypothetical protein
MNRLSNIYDDKKKENIRPFSACEICWGISKNINIKTTMKIVEPDGLKVRLCKEHYDMLQLEFD